MSARAIYAADVEAMQAGQPPALQLVGTVEVPDPGQAYDPHAAMIENLITIMLGILAIVLAAYSLQDSRR